MKYKASVRNIFLRSIDQSKDFCNDRRLQVNDLGKNVICAIMITRENIGKKIFIPTMDLVPYDSGLPFKFKRKQILIAFCFTMTINKNQGESYEH